MINTVFDKTSPEKEESFLHDILGNIVLRVVEEPEFDNLAALCPAMSETRTVIGLKDYAFAVGVDWDGTLNRGGYGFFDAILSDVRKKHRTPFDICFFKVGKAARKIRDLGYDSTKRKLLDGYLPVVVTWATCEGIEYEQTVFAHSEKMSSGKDMEIFIRFSIRNTEKGDKDFGIEVCTDPDNERSLKKISGRIKKGTCRNIYLKILYLNSGRTVYIDESGPAGNIRVSLLSCGEDGFNTALEECRDFWKSLLDEGMKIRTSEERVDNGCKAWQIYNILNVRKVNRNGTIICVPHSGSGYYGWVAGKEAPAAVHALSLTGHFKEARTCIKGLLAYQRENGLFCEQTGLADNGVLLSSVAQYYILSRDKKSFLEFLPAAKKMAEWIIKNRNLKQKDKGSITYGLLPAGKISGDMHDNDHTYRANIFNWKGLNELAFALDAAGIKKEAARLKKTAEEYRKDIYLSMKKSSFPERELFKPGEYLSTAAWRNRGVYQKGALTIVPMTPVNRRLEKLFGGGLYYAIEASQILETGFFETDDLMYQQIKQFLEKRGGILLGLLRWHEYAGIDHAYTYGYLLSKIREDKINSVLLGFYAMLAYGMSRDTFSAAEARSLLQGKGVYGSGEYGEGILKGSTHHCQPHLHSNTQQIRLLRMMLVREEKDNLLLAFSVPRQWVKNGLTVENAPTKWGSVSYSIKCDSKTATAKVAVSPIGEELPDTVQLRIRHPEKKRMKSVTIGNIPWKNFDPGKETVVFALESGETDMIIDYHE